jgi:hypothetical protein
MVFGRKHEFIIILLLILLFNEVIFNKIRVIEMFCNTEQDAYENPNSNYYKGVNDAENYINNNLTDHSEYRGLQKQNYTSSQQDECRKLGFKKGYSEYSKIKDHQKKEVFDDMFNLEKNIRSFSKSLSS